MDETGDGGEVRMAVGGQGYKDDILAAGAGDQSRGGDAGGVCEEDDLEQDGGVIGGCAGMVVVEAVKEDGEVQFIDDLVERELEGAGLKLLAQINGDHELLMLRVGFEAGHGVSLYR